MSIESKRNSTSSSKDDSDIVTREQYLLPPGLTQLNRYSSEMNYGDDYRDTDPNLSMLIKRPVIIPQE